MTTGTLDDHQPQGRWSTLRSRVGYVLIIVGVLTLVLIGVVIPMRYVIEGPGPTFNVLGKDGGKKIIQVSGAQTYPTKGQLRMVTVSLRGGPGSHVTGLEVLWALASKDSQVYREEEIYPKSLSADDVKKIAQAQMTGSQSSAEVAALTELGMTVPATFTVVSVGKDSPSAGKLKEGDVLTAITIDGTRHELKDGASLFSIMEKTPAKTPVTVDFNRSGVAHQVTVKSVKRPDGQGSIIGVGLDPKVKPPVKVTVSLQDVGGPSAGMMFALGIVDTMTKESLTRGQVIAGTGAISMGGGVQMISGVPQKMRGASDAGAHWFLLPSGNCADAAGAVPRGMRIVPVDTLHEARGVVEDIAAHRTSNLRTCPAK